MWAVKIFDDGPDDFNHKVLDLAQSWGAGVECASYRGKGMPESVDQRLRDVFAGKPHGLGLHLPHGQLSLIELAEQRWGGKEMRWAKNVDCRKEPNAIVAKQREGGEELSPAARRLALDAGWARSVGCVDAVIHVDREPIKMEGWRSWNPKALAIHCAPAIEAAWALGLRLHLEKTYEPLEWMDSFYKEAFRLGLSRKFGFTFDLGHSRVWSRAPLERWMALIEEFDKMGFGLHFHLHANSGAADSHDTLGHAQAMGWLGPDPAWAPSGVMPILSHIQRRYESKAMLVLETSSVHAWDNLAWVELALRR